MFSRLQRRTWAVLAPETDHPVGRVLNNGLQWLVILNAISAVMETVDVVAIRYGSVLTLFAMISIGVLAVMLVVRVWAIPVSEPTDPMHARVAFLRRPSSVLDLLVIVPFALGVFISIPEFQTIRLLWVLHLLGFPGFEGSRQRFRTVYRRKRDDLAIAFTGTGAVALFAATLLYLVERSAQPDSFGSIPAALWWSIVTLTTVGYGDVVPMTPLGQVLGALTTIVGIAIFALPASILASGFLIEAERHPDIGECPHCGHSLVGTDGDRDHDMDDL